MAENFLDLYRETNPGERRMQSARGLQDEGFQGIVKAYQMGRGGSEASEYDTKRAEAAGKYAKRQEAFDVIKTLKDTSEIGTNAFYSFQQQGDDEATASKKAAEIVSDLLYPIIGDKAKVMNFKPAKEADYFSVQVSEGGKNLVKFFARDKRSGAIAQWDNATQKYGPVKGEIVPKKTAAEMKPATKKEAKKWVWAIDDKGTRKQFQLASGENPPEGWKIEDDPFKEILREGIAERRRKSAPSGSGVGALGLTPPKR
jgi:hypothetical protein